MGKGGDTKKNKGLMDRDFAWKLKEFAVQSRGGPLGTMIVKQA